MFEVVIFKRSPTRWEWQVCDRKGNAIMRGWEHTRPAAKYRGNRALFLLLAAANYGPRETRSGRQRARRPAELTTADFPNWPTAAP